VKPLVFPPRGAGNKLASEVEGDLRSGTGREVIGQRKVKGITQSVSAARQDL